MIADRARGRQFASTYGHSIPFSIPLHGAATRMPCSAGGRPAERWPSSGSVAAERVRPAARARTGFDGLLFVEGEAAGDRPCLAATRASDRRTVHRAPVGVEGSPAGLRKARLPGPRAHLLSISASAGENLNGRDPEKVVPLHLRPLEHQHRRRPVRPAGPQGGRLRRQDPRVQEARLRRRAVPRRRRRAEVDLDPRGDRARPRPRSRSCSTARACSASSSPRGCGSTPRPSTAASPPTAPPSGVRHRALQAGHRHRQRAGLPATSSSGWPARARTSARPRTRSPSAGRILDAVNALLEYDPNIRILGEMKPNEPMDQAYLPTPGHFLALCYRTADPSRVRRADRVGPLDPGRPRPVRRHGLRPVARQAVERPPQRPERPEVRPGQGVRLGGPAPGVQHGLGAGARPATTAASAWTSRRCARTQAGRPDQAPGQQPGDVQGFARGAAPMPSRPFSRSMGRPPWGASIQQARFWSERWVMVVMSKNRLAPGGRERYPAIVCSSSCWVLTLEIG